MMWLWSFVNALFFFLYIVVVPLSFSRSHVPILCHERLAIVGAT